MTTHENIEPDPTRRLTVTRGRHGWEVMEERGNRVVRRVNYTDWHRVERALGLHGQDANAVAASTMLRRPDADSD